MTQMKKVLLGVGGALAVLLTVLLALPLFLVDRIEERVRSGIEGSTQIQVSWSDVGFSFFRGFPHATVTFTDLEVIGTGEFAEDTLAAMADLRLTVNAPSALRAVRGTGPLEVRSLHLGSPTLHMRVTDDGVANWTVLPDRAVASTDVPGRPIAVSLRNVTIADGTLVLDNAVAGVYASMEGLEHSLSGDFSRESLIARTLTHAEAVTVRFAGTPYLGGVTLDLVADFDVDMTERRARLTDNELRLNDLLVRLDGTLTRASEDLAVDLTFGAPSTEFAEVLSLLPGLYAQDFAAFETGGTFALEGRAQGVYGEEAFPSFAVDLAVTNGRFRHPEANVDVSAIGMDLSVSNPGGDIDSTIVDLSRFHAEVDGQPVDASLVLRTPLSDPDVDVRVEGTIDLGAAARAARLDNADEVSGVIVADAQMRARSSDVDAGRYERIDARGTVSMADVALRGEALRQPVDVEEATLVLTPQTAELRSFDARLGSSDLQASGQLDNVLGFAMGTQPLRGTATFSSHRFVLDEWKSDDEVEVIAVPDILDLALDGTIDELVFNGLETRNARGRMLVRDQRVTLEDFALEALGGRIGVNGFYETLDPTQPTFGLGLELDSLDVAGASEAFLTVRALAPVARYTRGTFSSALNLSGGLGEDMAPALDLLDGDGSLATSRLAIEGFPLLDRLSETLQLQRLSNPTVEAVRSNVRIQGGRLVVDPFPVTIGGLAMTVSGSNGIDQSIAYTLGMVVPRSGLGDAALARLGPAAGALGMSLDALDQVPLSIGVTGSVTQPSIDVGMGQAAGSVGSAITQSAEAAAQARVDDARQRADAEREVARQKARAQADSIVAEAERQADGIRAEAARAATRIRAEGGRAADELLARATNPLARVAAQPAADRLRSEADQRATALEEEANARATSIVEEARARADALVGEPGG